jgi:hypothetical protein
VKFEGLHLAFPFIDRVFLSGNFFGKDVELFVMDENDPTKRVEIDFKAGSAPVDAAAWYQIGDPEALRRGDREKLASDILKYAYTVLPEEREERIIEIFEGALRPVLQQRTIEEAQTGSTQASKEGVEEAQRTGLTELGVYPMPGKGIIIRDIELPIGIVELRQLELTGEKRALEMKAASGGYWASIQEIIDAAARATPSIVLSPDKAQEIFERQIALATISKTGANITFIASDIDGVVKTITVGPKGTTP